MILREVEARGRTVDEAAAEAVRLIGLPPEAVSIEVLDAGTKGFLGLGSREALVRARPGLTSAQLVQTVVSKLLEAGGYRVTVEATEGEEGAVKADIRGEDLGELIGRHGRTLDALGYLLNAIFARVPGGPRQVIVDVAGYRGRRDEAIQRMAMRAAETVRRTGTSFSLEAMPAAERRTVHLVLQAAGDVTTHSEGDEPYRRVVVAPARRR